MRVIGKLLSILTYLCYVVILVILVVAAPMAIGYKPVVVLTGSMEPAYPVGSVIYYKATSFEDIKGGDVISYRISDDARTAVTHRVVSVDAENMTFITKGDANKTADPNMVNYTNVMGKVISYHLQYVGYFVKYVQNIIVIAIAFMILVAKLVFDRIFEPSDQNKPTPPAVDNNL